MGCDIHMFAERKGSDGKYQGEARDELESRSYGTFAFLADVRNYSGVTPIAAPRGIPEDASEQLKAVFESWGVDAHTPSWLSIEELLAFDYTAQMEDRRALRQISSNLWSGGETCEPGQGRTMTYAEFLGEWFFKDVKSLQDSGFERIVFWFDN